MTAHSGVGVTALWRYPVKSMQGEQLTEASLGPTGIIGDRDWALIDDETGLALTARRQPELLYASAALVDDGVRITLPDGSVAPDNDALSAWLGHAVTLTRASPGAVGTYEIALDFEHEDTAEWFQWQGPTGSFHDSARTQVSIIGAATVGGWDMRRFRPNVVVHGTGEDGWVGSTIHVGGAALDVVKTIGRCVITTRPQPSSIERDLSVLKTINRDRAGKLGVGALVQTPGRVTVGDEISAP